MFHVGPASVDVHAGLEYEFRNLVAVRVGYNDVRQLTLGAGIRLPKLAVDYSFAKFDQTDQLRTCTVPLHVVAFSEDVEAPPQDAEIVASLAPTAELHVFDGMGHGSIYGHAHDVLNPFIEGIVERYV